MPVDYISNDYIKINNIISEFRNTDLIVNENNVSDNFIKNNINILERGYMDKVINLAKDICRFNYIVRKDTLTLKQGDIELAKNLLKKDF
jgi:hypothetical protein